MTELTPTHLALLLLVALPLAPGSTAAAPGSTGSSGPAVLSTAVQGLRELLEAELASAEEREVDELWQRAFALRDAESLGEEGELDRMLERMLAGDAARGPRGVLLFAAARLLGEDPDHSALARTLVPLLAGPEAEARAAAALLSEGRFKSLPDEEREELLQELLRGARDGGRAPELRLALASAAYEIGGGRVRLEALGEMREFFNSSDPLLRSEGALALAAAGVAVEGKLRRVLEELEHMPDDRGRLAAAYLKQEGLRELYERRVDEREEPSDPELEEFERVLDMIRSQHLEGDQFPRERLIQAAMDGMLHWMDPHSSYLSSESYSEFSQDLEAEYGGIGAYVLTDVETGLFTIVRPIYSGPAYEAGLRTNDAIVRIDDWPTLEHDSDEIIKRLKGQPGTDVKVYVWRDGMEPELIKRPTEDMAVTVRRERIEVPAGAFQMLPGMVGLVELSTFSRKAMIDVRRDLEQLRDAGARAIVLDLRNNQGGLLTQAREVADLFLPPGKVVATTQGRRGEPQVHRTQEEPVIPEDMPLLVLTNRFSASAAEIVAGALQDHGRAELVGTRTYGKGSVQQLLEVAGLPEDRWKDENGNHFWDPWEPILEDHDGDGVVDYRPRVKLTIARYLLPSGRSIHRELDHEGNLKTEGGVDPDHLAKERTYDLWRVREMRRVEGEGAIRAYVNDHWDGDRELFGMLAVNDRRDPELYPDFDELMAGLSTPLARDDVRRLVRSEIRRRVQDDQGFEFPLGDFVEDPQLQKAIELALAKLGETPDDVAEFGLVFDTEALQGHAKDEGLAVLGRDTEADVRRALALLMEAREQGQNLSQEELEELTSILEGIERN